MIRQNTLVDFKVTSGPVSEPVDLITVKNWLDVKFDQDDQLLTDIISSVRHKLEKITGLSFGYKSMTALIAVDDYCQLIDLPYGPVDVIDSVEYRDGVSSWEAQTESTSTATNDYELFGAYSSKVKVNKTGYWRFTYQGGFSSLPDDLLLDMKTLCAWYYENRGHVMKGEQLNVDIYPNEMLLNAQKYKAVVV